MRGASGGKLFRKKAWQKPPAKKTNLVAILGLEMVEALTQVWRLPCCKLALSFK